MFYYFLQILLLCAIRIEAYFDKTYNIPNPEINIKPNGFEVSIKHEQGISVFYFYGKIISDNKNEDIIMKTLVKNNDRWVLESYRNLKKGDIMFYWVYVKKEGVGYRLTPRYYEVSKSNDNTLVTSIIPISKYKDNYEYVKMSSNNCNIACSIQIKNLTQILSFLQGKINYLREVVMHLNLEVNAATQSEEFPQIGNYVVY
ncbi:hypothetical protein FQA39_LY05401 [Lamprigera yunnana]|nr:hypothetical protein FQA39_LY05401 [Lamprigera yunnana]